MYIPSLEFGVADGIYDIIDGIVGDIYKQASMIKRLATHSGQDHYQVSFAVISQLAQYIVLLMSFIPVMNMSRFVAKFCRCHCNVIYQFWSERQSQPEY